MLLLQSGRRPLLVYYCLHLYYTHRHAGNTRLFLRLALVHGRLHATFTLNLLSRHGSRAFAANALAVRSSTDAVAASQLASRAPLQALGSPNTTGDRDKCRQRQGDL